eukprot:gene35101-43276_t
MLSTMGILLPTVLHQSGEDSSTSDNGFSRATSIVLFLIYFVFLYFQLKTHKYLYEETDEGESDETENVEMKSGIVHQHTANKDLEVGLLNNSLMSESDSIISNPVNSAAIPSKPTVNTTSSSSSSAIVKEGQTEAEDDDEEEDELGYTYALVWLAIITVFIAFLSDAISSSIQDAASSAGISGIFLAAIVLPIVGNAAEHAGAVMF